MLPERFKKVLIIKSTVILLLLIATLFVSQDSYYSPIVQAKDNDNKSHRQELTKYFYENTIIKVFENNKDLSFIYPKTNTSEELPLVRGKNALVVNLNKKQILFERDSRKKVSIASLTKIMTAVIALEHMDLDKEITISHKAASIGENTMNLTQGEKYTLEELLYGLVLHSGNDAAYAISEGVAGNTETFVEWMNMKAKDLGLEDTHFADPSGLDDNNYSTAYDLAKLTQYALRNPDFSTIVATFEHNIKESSDNKYLPLYNQTNLLTTYPGVRGVKTGYTEAAGLCLITYAINDGQEIIGVILASDARKTDMIQMLDHGYEKLGITIKHPLLDF